MKSKLIKKLINLNNCYLAETYATEIINTLKNDEQQISLNELFETLSIYNIKDAAAIIYQIYELGKDVII